MNLKKYKESLKDSNKIIKELKIENMNENLELSFIFYVRAITNKELKKFKESLNDLDLYLKFNKNEKLNIENLKREILNEMLK